MEKSAAKLNRLKAKALEDLDSVLSDLAGELDEHTIKGLVRVLYESNLIGGLANLCTAIDQMLLLGFPVDRILKEVDNWGWA